MINKGFVTNSDTLNEDKLRQRYRNKVNNAQGQHFEREILAGCGYYERTGAAVIDKTPEPFRVTKKNKDGIFTGRFSTPAQPDFQGTLSGGRSIVFEAKRTSKDRITRNVLTDKQMELLEKHYRTGAICGVCVCIQDDFFFIPWKKWGDMKELYGKQYITAEDAEEYRVKFDGAVYFLEKVLESGGKQA